MRLRNVLRRSFLALPLLLLALASCETTRQDAGRPTKLDRALSSIGDEILVCGKRFSTHGAPVVLWSDRGGFNAYDKGNHFPNTEPIQGNRYTPGRSVENAAGERSILVPANSRDPRDLEPVVDQFVLHYDVCGTSERCFMVLHDQRKLSVHFLLDVDGTIYQTMDVRDQAWHASNANPRSVGVEIANIGAYPEGAREPLELWYDQDAIGPFIALEMLAPWKVRKPGFIARPRTRELVKGLVHGTEYAQYDLTQAQYDSLAKLAAALSTALPNLALDAPRDTRGRVRTDLLSDEEYDAFRGVLGHYHVSAHKQDPGPAFDWEFFLKEARREAIRP